MCSQGTSHLPGRTPEGKRHIREALQPGLSPHGDQMWQVLGRYPAGIQTELSMAKASRGAADMCRGPDLCSHKVIQDPPSNVLMGKPESPSPLMKRTLLGSPH
jgi:hypothetical protein